MVAAGILLRDRNQALPADLLRNEKDLVLHFMVITSTFQITRAPQQLPGLNALAGH